MYAFFSCMPVRDFYDISQIPNIFHASKFALLPGCISLRLKEFDVCVFFSFCERNYVISNQLKLEPKNFKHIWV